MLPSESKPQIDDLVGWIALAYMALHILVAFGVGLLLFGFLAYHTVFTIEWSFSFIAVTLAVIFGLGAAFALIEGIFSLLRWLGGKNKTAKELLAVLVFTIFFGGLWIMNVFGVMTGLLLLGLLTPLFYETKPEPPISERRKQLQSYRRKRTFDAERC